jgi:integrase/recombinase XerD
VETDVATDLLASWERALKAARKSPYTIENYHYGALAYLRWCTAAAVGPDFTREQAQDFVIDVMETNKPSTAGLRLKALKLWAAWLTEEGEIPVNELAGMTPPREDSDAIGILDADQLRRLIATCHGPGRGRYKDLRDEAIIRFMAETTARAGEVVRMQLADVDLNGGKALLHGKGGKERYVGLGDKTAYAIDKYLRARRRHPLARETERFWLPITRGKVYGYSGLYRSLTERAAEAGLVGFHPHMLRSTAAVRWLQASGSTTGLMSTAGWSSVTMLQRYIRTAESTLAIEEAKRLNTGDY